MKECHGTGAQIVMGRGKARANPCRVESNVLIFPPQSAGKLLNGILSKRVTQSDLYLKKIPG